jgi:hypothetical protein
MAGVGIISPIASDIEQMHPEFPCPVLPTIFILRAGG